MKTHFNRQAKLFLFATILYGIAFSFWQLFFNIYILSRGFPKDSLGFILAATPIAALLLGLPLGKLADRIGHRKAMFIGLAVGLTGMLFEVILQNQWLVFIMALVQGAGLMLYRVAQPPFIMSNSTQQNRTMFFSLNFSLMTFAGMVGSLVAGQLPGIAGRILSIQSDNAAAYQMVIIAGIVLGATSLIPIFF
ncbi:MAG: MFS transporter, partial [Anaerolineaceae bacterium]|nr:MFS transporter [Anaerolineaceae bacterium]